MGYRLFTVTFLLASAAPVVTAVRLLALPHTRPSGAVAWGAGTVASLLLWRVFRRFGFANTLAHEFGHMAMALALRGSVHELFVTARAGGRVVHSSPVVLPVAIAPYCVPVLALLIVVLAAVRQGPPTLAVGAGIGLACGYHITRAVDDMRANFSVGWRTSDVATHGPFVTLGWVWTGNAIVLSSLAAFAAGGWPQIEVLWGESFVLTQRALAVALSILNELTNDLST